MHSKVRAWCTSKSIMEVQGGSQFLEPQSFRQKESVCPSFFLRLRNLAPREAVTYLWRPSVMVALEPESLAGVLSPVTAAMGGLIV